MDKVYPVGNVDFLRMIESKQFDQDLANRFISAISDVNAPINDLRGFSTTYLYEATLHNNEQAVQFLLEHGADPNLYIPGLISDCALWDLMYIYPQDDAQIRYRIAKMFFAYGANPSIVVEGESIYDFVVFEVYNNLPSEDHWCDHLIRFLKLLVIYGGSGPDYGKPQLIDIDLSKVDDYHFSFFEGGTILDKNGNVKARLC